MEILFFIIPLLLVVLACLIVLSIILDNVKAREKAAKEMDQRAQRIERGQELIPRVQFYRAGEIPFSEIATKFEDVVRAYDDLMEIKFAILDCLNMVVAEAGLELADNYDDCMWVCRVAHNNTNSIISYRWLCDKATEKALQYVKA